LRELVDRCAPVADMLGNFLDTLRNASKTAPHPATDLEAAVAGQSKVQ
jgi:hypothetical protein